MNDPGGSVRSYAPGDWFGVVGERAVVILPPTEKARVAALWELVDGGAGFDVTLDALISGGLRELPGFVLVSTSEGETKVVIRGPARAEFDVAGETVHLEGRSATTWVERSLPGVTRMSIVLTEPHEGEEPGGELPTYVVDGGLFRVSRLDESPAHVGTDELTEEPAYEQEHPLGLLAHPEAETQSALPTEPDVEPEAEQAAHDLGPDTEPEPPPDPVLRSPEPPSWTPSSPGPPPPPLLPPIPPAPSLPPLLPPTEAMQAPVPDLEPDPEPEAYAEADSEPDEYGEPDEDGRLVEHGRPAPAELGSEADDVDHDGLTVTGSWQPAPAPYGIPGQEPAPDVTIPVARLVLSSGEVIDVDRAIVVGRAPEARRFNGTEQPRLVTVVSPQLEISSTHLEVRPGSGADHGSAVVMDLGSTNGTVLVQPGLGPEDLSPGVAVQLIPGALIDLGDGVTIQVTRP